MPTLSYLADYLQAETVGDLNFEVTALASLAKAKQTDISFVASDQMLAEAKVSKAGILVVNAEVAAALEHNNLLIHQNPYFCFAQLTHLFDTAPRFKPGVHHSAVIAESAKISASAFIGANVVIGDQVVIGDHSVIEANSVINDGCQLGTHCHLHNQVALYHDVILGDDVIIHSSAVIGSDGFGYAPTFNEQRKWHKIKQLGTVVIGNRVEIGAATTIDRGALDDTVINQDVIIDNHVHIGHNCRIGEGTAIAGCVGIAGSSIIGKFCSLAGGVGIAGHLEIADNTIVTGMTMVTKSIKKSGSYSAGTPMMTTKDWRKSAVRFSQLEKLNQRVKKLET